MGFSKKIAKVLELSACNVSSKLVSFLNQKPLSAHSAVLALACECRVELMFLHDALSWDCLIRRPGEVEGCELGMRLTLHRSSG